MKLKSKIQRANTFFKDCKFVEAEEIYHQIVREEPSYADIYCKLGVIAHDKENYSQAIDYFRKALEINPKYYEAMMNLSITYNHIGKTEDGKFFFDRAINLGKEGNSQLDLVQKYRLANEHLRIADIYYEAGVYDRGILEYKMALDLCPNFPDIIRKLGLMGAQNLDHFFYLCRI